MLEIKRILTGAIQENCYLIYNEKECLIVDPGADADKIIAAIQDLDIKPIAILLTHCHYDHIGALEEVRNYFTIPVYVDPLEQSWLTDPELNLSSALGQPPVSAQPAEFEFSYRNYTLGDFNFKVVPTPGHSVGSVSFIFDDFVVSGDALFKGSIGRTDLPNGNFEQLIASITTQLFTLPDSLAVYAGHGEVTTIGNEKATNPFFN
ncbi:MBL fold metallo-hydrolase [Carnobacterium maltaromaticum]|uniref:Uncharacterized protein M6_Spy0554 n=1 Tax=Carnobacterium maltaromaticum LMA28 TaxID=1234679 RepID=K8EK30_CARML|nr:MBL fold metallo-hydrolase [Carnobacterium maltaromaticum]KRN66465.1 metal-binding hydrolase [Carnobacterium maltaromaticum DSM 20342]MDW5523757.1 MBL fold metallo-hydrolase [Carnobacterium maltaromaticum]CCO12233.2 uncharacterized protein M6_Spy0554 [Carnobacterium maltaromaticum LMA28]